MKTHRYINLSDDELVELVRAGDNRPFEELFNRYEKKIVCYAIKNNFFYKLGKFYQMEDLVSDIMLKVFSSIKNSSYSQGNLYSWIMTVTKNHFINMYRSAKSAGTVSLEEAPDEILTKWSFQSG